MEDVLSAKDALSHWYKTVAKKRGLSWQFLANRLEKSASHLRKIASGEANTTFEFERDVLSYFYKGREEEVCKFLERAYPKQYTKFIQFSGQMSDKLTFSRDEFYEIVDDQTMYYIYRLADAGSFTVKDIEGLVGPEAVWVVNKLEDLGAVYIENKVVYRCEESRNQFNTNFVITAKSFAHNIRLVTRRAIAAERGGPEFDSSSNKLLGVYETVSDEAHEWAIETMLKCVREIRETLKLPENKGDRPTFINTAVCRFEDLKMEGK